MRFKFSNLADANIYPQGVRDYNWISKAQVYVLPLDPSTPTLAKIPRSLAQFASSYLRETKEAHNYSALPRSSFNSKESLSEIRNFGNPQAFISGFIYKLLFTNNRTFD